MSTFCLCYCNLSISKKVKEISFILRDRIHCDVNFSFIINDIGNIFLCSAKMKKNIMHVCAQIYIYMLHIYAQRDRVHGDVNTSRIPLTPLSLAANKHWECASTALKTSKWIYRQTETKTSRQTDIQTNISTNHTPMTNCQQTLRVPQHRKKQTNKASKNHSLISGHQQTLIVANRALNLEHKQT